MKALNKLFIALINFYQVTVSSITPPCCRFSPSCSSYAKQAFQKFSFFKAMYLVAKRICKCHPFHPGGYDPIP